MARKPRIHLPGGLYHVIFRGNGGQPVFFCDEDRFRFYLLLQEGAVRFGYRVHAFCLMTNHIHLALQCGDLPLQRGMQNLSFRYTRWINWQTKRTGHLFQGRYKAVLVDSDGYLLELVRYIRRCFMFDRKLLADLSRIAWETLKEYTSTPFDSAQDRSLSAGTTLPGCACSIQTFGDFLGFNPHCHIIISDGTFDEYGNFRITPYYDAHALEQLFRHKLLKMVLNKGAISQWHIDLLMSWQHSGFNVHVCEPIAADDCNALESLAHYIIRCQFSQERMTYLKESGTVIYRSKDGLTTKTFSALDWLAMIISHIPRHGEQMVRYYGYYSNAARGKRRKQGVLDDKTPEIAGQEQDTGYRKKCRANWARLIQKIYEIDPLTCPKCNGTMRILAFIEEDVVIRKILEHLGLWDVPKRQPKQGRGPPVIVEAEPQLEYAASQLIEYEEAYYEPEYL